MPAPPSSSSTVTPSTPSWPSSGHRSRGNWLVRSISSARGASRSDAKLRTVSRSMSAASPRSKSSELNWFEIIAPPVLQHQQGGQPQENEEAADIGHSRHENA